MWHRVAGGMAEYFGLPAKGGALGRNEVECVAVGSPREARYPLIETGCQVLDLMRFAIIDPQAKQVGLVAVASLRRVSDVSAVGRILW